MPENEAELAYELLEFLNFIEERFDYCLRPWQPDEVKKLVAEYIKARLPIDPDVVGLDIPKGDNSK